MKEQSVKRNPLYFRVIETALTHILFNNYGASICPAANLVLKTSGSASTRMGIDTSVLRQNEKTLSAILQMKSFGFESQSTHNWALGGNGIRD